MAAQIQQSTIDPNLIDFTKVWHDALSDKLFIAVKDEPSSMFPDYVDSSIIMSNPGSVILYRNYVRRLINRKTISNDEKMAVEFFFRDTSSIHGGCHISECEYIADKTGKMYKFISLCDEYNDADLRYSMCEPNGISSRSVLLANVIVSKESMIVYGDNERADSMCL